jgi:hypothetical protein
MPARTNKASDRLEPSAAIWVMAKAAIAITIAAAVAGLTQPRSAIPPAIGAAIAPATPASANRATPFCVSPNSGPMSTSGIVVQKRLKAPNMQA